MQQDLWGSQDIPTPPIKQRVKAPVIVKVTPQDCVLYGHTWQQFGFSGEKRCNVCHIVGYCPLCTPHAPPNTKPFYCSIHTPAERE